MIEQSFDSRSPDALLTEIEASQREESTLMARRMAAIADLLAHRTAEAEHADPDPGYSMITGFARTSAEVGSAMNMAPMTASLLVSHAEALDARLPRLAALLGEGAVDWRTAQLIITRTELVSDELIGQVDESMAERLRRWQCWSRRRIINTVDSLVRTVDSDAAKERRASSERDRYLSVAAQADGTAQVRGRITATAAAAFDQRISQLAMSVCAKDSRTVDQRRADALSALTEGRGLSCDCVQPNCPARGTDDSHPGSGVRTVINVIASEATVTGDSEQPGYLAGFGVIDADVVRELAENAALRLLEQPTVSEAESVRYQPTAEVERWVRFRDLTCRFPGCDRPAAICDLDHTTPFNHANPAAGGLTAVRSRGLLPRASPSQDLPRRSRRLARQAVARRHHCLDGADGTDLPHHARRHRAVPTDAPGPRRTRAYGLRRTRGPGLRRTRAPGLRRTHAAETQPLPRKGSSNQACPQQGPGTAADQRRPAPSRSSPPTGDRHA